MTFAEIERVTGTKLPTSARKYRPWWSNNARNSVMTKVWLDAGFRTEQVDMVSRKVVFRRIQKPNAGESPSGQLKPIPSAGPTVRRHPLRGLLKEVTQIPRGVDLTEPADPEWAALVDSSDR
jgi:hypothetical protein